jgi:hypothetical protein
MVYKLCFWSLLFPHIPYILRNWNIQAFSLHSPSAQISSLTLNMPWIKMGWTQYYLYLSSKGRFAWSSSAICQSDCQMFYLFICLFRTAEQMFILSHSTMSSKSQWLEETDLL